MEDLDVETVSVEVEGQIEHIGLVWSYGSHHGKPEDNESTMDVIGFKLVSFFFRHSFELNGKCITH